MRSQRQRWLLLFFPAYLLRYLLLERFNPASVYHVVQSPLDAFIPFCEWFLIPYVLWYAAIVGTQLYTLRTDPGLCRRYTRFWLVCVCCTTVIYLLYPTCQQLRPTVFPRDNLMSRLVAILYAADTSTNICPSEHVIGAVGVWLAGRRCPRLRTPGWQWISSLFAVAVILSTLFLKQHSIIDTLAALPVCLLGWWFSFRKAPPLCWPTGEEKAM